MTAPMPNFKPQTIWTGDCLDIMRGMNSESIDLIYLDPPFNSKANYAAPIGSKAAGAEFKDTWGLDDVKLVWHGEIQHEYPGLYAHLDAARQIHGDSMMSYLIYMAIRIMEMRRVLKQSGSVYLHCDPTASHYLKLLMDSIFGKANFRNEIIWRYRTSSGRPAKHFIRNTDSILFYTKTSASIFNHLREPWPESTLRKWQTDEVGIYRMNAGKKYYINPEGKRIDNVWEITLSSRSKERTGYPTQKPLALLRRIIQASSNEGDMVLDPFCGCATTCVAAEQLQRRWVGIDISPKAAELVVSRMRGEVGLLFKGAHRTDIPKRTDLGKMPRYNAPENKKYLYGEQGGYCNGCAEHFESRHLQIDHIVPRAKGGTDHISNLQLLCGSCNATKGAKTHEELIVLLTDKGWIKRRRAWNQTGIQP